MKKLFCFLVIIVLVFSGCSKREKILSKTLPSSNRTYLALYETKLLYINADSQTTLHLYDFKKDKELFVCELSNFFLKGTSNALIDTALYFYITERRNEIFLNVLFSFDFKTLELREVSTNAHSQHLIPVVKFNDSVHSLERNKDNEEWQPSFLLKHTGKTSQVVKLIGKIESYDILSLHSDDSFLYTIENSVDDDTFFIGKYDQNYELTSYFEITDLYTNQKVVNGIKSFYALDDKTFYITDYNSNSVLFLNINDEMSVIMSGKNLLYAADYSNHQNLHYFLITGSNTFYSLDVNTQKLTKSDFTISSTNNNSTSFALSFHNKLLLLKRNADLTETLYLYENI